MDADKTLATVDAITKALSEYTTGWPNPEARQVIDRYISTLKDLAPRHSSEKISSFSNWMDILFSARKHQGYRRPGVDGATMVKSFALSDLASIRIQIAQVQMRDADLSNSE